MFKVKYMEHRKNLGFGLVALLAFVQGVLRTYFGLVSTGVLGAAAHDQLMTCIDVPVNNEMAVIAAPFLLLGVLGIAATVGLVMRTQWGYYGTMIVSAATIVYDLWAAVAIQSSAVFGMFVPVILIVYLVMRRSAFGTSSAVRA